MSQSLTEWLLLNYGQERMRPGLERIREVLTPYLAAFSRTRIITIAGTNGKGETTLRLSRLLREHSHFCWISPHIERITERFRTERGEIDLEVLTELIHRCHQDLQQQEVKLSYYEFLFYVFCRWAAAAAPEFLLLEVGLGGRLDAVNIFDAEMVLLPSISRDHQEFLGKRYDGILEEKLALLRPGSMLISYLSLKYLRERAGEICQRHGAQLVELEETGLFQEFEFSQRNQLLAYAAYLYVNHTPAADLELQQSYRGWTPQVQALEHRGEVWQASGEWVFFGTHNTDGMRKLIQFLHSGNYTFKRPPFDAVICSFSQRDSGEIKLMLQMLKRSGLGRIIVSAFTHPKAASRNVLQGLSQDEGIEFAEDIGPYFQDKHKYHLLVLGSYYFLGAVKSRYCRR